MKKLFWILTVFIIFSFVCPVINVYAQQEVSGLTEELEIDTDSLGDSLTPEVREIIEEKGLAPGNTEAIAAITPIDVIKYVWKQFRKSVVKPMRVLASLMAVILVAAVIESMEDSISSKSMSKIFGVICVLVSVGIVSS